LSHVQCPMSYHTSHRTPPSPIVSAPPANQFYGLLFVLVGILFVPIALLREPPPDAIPPMSLSTFLSEVWDTLETRTTLHLILFVLGVHTLAHVHNKATVFMQVNGCTRPDLHVHRQWIPGALIDRGIPLD